VLATRDYEHSDATLLSEGQSRKADCFFMKTFPKMDTEVDSRQSERSLV